MAGIGDGVLIRALEPRDGIPIMQGNRQIERLRDLARGPGRLTAALRVDGRFDGLDPCREGPLWLGRCDHEPGEIGHSIRIGIACDFIFGAVRSSAVQDRLGNKGPYQAVVVRVLSFALASGSAHSNRSNNHLFRREIHGYSVDAITQMGRCGALVKNVPEMASTTCAMNFGPDASVSPASCLDANVTGYYHRLPSRKRP